MKNTLFIMALLLAILLTGCAPSAQQITQSLDTWIGQHQSALYQSWGPPNMVTEDGQGGSILIYYTNVSMGQLPGAVTVSNGTAYYSTPQNVGYTKTRMFYVDSAGKIYGHKWQGK